MDGATRVVFFVQDSVVPECFVEDLSAALSQMKSVTKACAIGPVFFDIDKNFTYPLIKLDKYGLRRRIIAQSEVSPIEVSMLISSGTLMNLDILKQVGLMNESFFIDYVDTEWCLRAISLGFKFYAVPSVRMGHSIGDRSISLFGRHIPLHSSFRRYYRVRNATLMLKLPHVPKLLAFRELCVVLAQQIFFIAVVGSDRMGHASSLARGLYDGIMSVDKNP
jgi:rhamnosyltransferase